MLKLSETQKNALYHCANVAMTRVVRYGNSRADAWVDASRSISHKATIDALIVRGLFEKGTLTKKGIAAAKEIFAETFPDKGKDFSWNKEVSEAVKRRNDYDAAKKKARADWQQYLDSLPIPDGYKPPLGNTLSIEWRSVEFSYAPTIQISDKNAPFMNGGRYKKPAWEMSFSTGSGMDAEAVRIFKEALDFAQTVMTTLEVRYANEEVIDS